MNQYIFLLIFNNFSKLIDSFDCNNQLASADDIDLKVALERLMSFELFTLSSSFSHSLSSSLTLSLLSSPCLALYSLLLLIDDHQICAFYAQLKAEMCGVAAMWRCIVQPIVAHRCGKSNLLPMAEGRLAAAGRGVAKEGGVEVGERQRCYCCLLPSVFCLLHLPPATDSASASLPPAPAFCCICIDLCAGGNIKTSHQMDRSGGTTIAGIGIRIGELGLCKLRKIETKGREGRGAALAHRAYA